MWSNEKNKKVTINMKKYIKPKIEIIHAAPAQLMGISQTELSSSNSSVIRNANTQVEKNTSMIGGDEVLDGDVDLDASKRWNDWGDITYKGYDPWK